MIRISAVSYLNTFPFIFGLKQSGINDECEITTDVPAKCAQKLIDNEVDIGLVPVAVIPQLAFHQILTDYCIGAKGEVFTVLLLSNKPLNEINEIYLDNESRTSVQLVKILARYFWNKNPEWKNITLLNNLPDDNSHAKVLIGDKTFSKRKDYLYVYDLAEEWYKFTGLPFVFACWIANKPIPDNFIDKFNAAIEKGVKNIDATIAAFEHIIPADVDAKAYYTDYISYKLDEDKIKGMNLFLEYLKNER